MTTPSTPPPRPTERNQVEASLAWFRWYDEHGLEAPEDDAEIVTMLHDDVDGFLDLLDAQG